MFFRHQEAFTVESLAIFDATSGTRCLLDSVTLALMRRDQTKGRA